MSKIYFRCYISSQNFSVLSGIFVTRKFYTLESSIDIVIHGYVRGQTISIDPVDESGRNVSPRAKTEQRPVDANKAADRNVYIEKYNLFYGHAEDQYLLPSQNYLYIIKNKC